MQTVSRILPVLMCLTMLSSCASDVEKAPAADPNEKNSGSVFAMDTYITVTAYGENGEKGISAATKEIERLEKLWSVTDEGSEIYAADHAGVSRDFCNGKVKIVFSVTVYVLNAHSVGNLL